MMFLKKKVDPEKYKNAALFVQDALEQIQSFVYQNTILQKDLVAAKERYIELTGKIPNAEDDFNQRMNFFLNWFIFDWHSVNTKSMSILELYLKKLVKENNQKLYDQLKKFKQSLHSIFLLDNINNGITTIVDIFTKKKYYIADDHFLFGLETGSFFDTRLICYNQQHVLIHYYNNHPKDVKSIISKQVRLITKSKSSLVQKEHKKKELIMKINYFKNKLLIYKHVDSKEIYLF